MVHIEHKRHTKKEFEEMGKILYYTENKPEEDALIVERTPEFYSIAQALSDMIDGLPLDKKQNDELVFKIIEQVQEAERGALIQGVIIGQDAGTQKH